MKDNCADLNEAKVQYNILSQVSRLHLWEIDCDNILLYIWRKLNKSEKNPLKLTDHDESCLRLLQELSKAKGKTSVKSYCNNCHSGYYLKLLVKIKNFTFYYQHGTKEHKMFWKNHIMFPSSFAKYLIIINTRIRSSRCKSLIFVPTLGPLTKNHVTWNTRDQFHQGVLCWNSLCRWTSVIVMSGVQNIQMSVATIFVFNWCNCAF